MSTDQVLSGVGLIVVLAVGSQVLASRLRIPALILPLPAGFTAGALTSDVNPERLPRAAFQPLVSLAVAVILYDAVRELEWGKVRGRSRRVVPPADRNSGHPGAERDWNAAVKVHTRAPARRLDAGPASPGFR